MTDERRQQRFTSALLRSAVLLNTLKEDREQRIKACPQIRELLLAALVSQQAKTATPIIWVTRDEYETEQVYGRIRSWADILGFHEPVHAQTGCLKHSSFHDLEDFSKGRKRLLVADTSYFDQAVPAAQEFRTTGLSLAFGQTLALHDFADRCAALGYLPSDMVTGVNQFSRRGGIVDIYLSTLSYPVRIEFWGDEIASLRYFDPQDQRSLRSRQNQITSIYIPSLTAASFTGNLWDYTGGAQLIVDESLLKPDEKDLATNKFVHELTIVPRPVWIWCDSEGKYALTFDAQPLLSAQGKLKNFYTSLLDHTGPEVPSLIISAQSRRLKDSLSESRTRIYGKIFEGRDDISDQITFQELDAGLFPVQGFAGGSLGFNVFSDYEIFGLVQSTHQTSGYIRKQYKHFLYTVEKGDLVVHSDHGVCIFEAVMQMKAAGIEREYLLLRFADEDKVYLPTSQIYKLSKYAGKDKETVTLSRLGGKSWTRERRKTEVDTAAIARELLELYARRAASTGFAFPEDDYLERELAASFPYLETTDQMRAIVEVIKDMCTAKPMDRLVCGDVGFGKTEVAIRAAFKAVNGGKQAAILCPTTILAEQHFRTFSERLAPYSTKIGLLSRMRSPKENLETLASLKSGELDIIIGTHRLLSPDVKFSDLGFLIVDEEQRFGVTHKEKIKALRTHIDILSLSATPIPRTLNLALSGIRDVSLIATPPKGRLSIATYVQPYAESTIKNAIEAEMDRGGQVFLIYNRVRSIDTFARRVAELVPRARIAVGHGQMDSEELEEKMHAFVHGKLDVLVSSTIVENGVDIPAANTMLVIGAEDFGLSSLYQLKGRIGRSDRQAYAYFLFREEKLTAPARERLDALKEHTELGSGLSIALRDLEIRGAGSILGIEQSGHIEGIGFELYSKLLKKAIARQSQLLDPEHAAYQTESEAIDALIDTVSVDLPLSASIPEEYIRSDTEKMAIYQRMSELATEQEVRELMGEMMDRFGQLPLPVNNLLTLLNLRLLAYRAGISKIWIKNGILFFEFFKTPTDVQKQTLYRHHSDWKIADRTARLHFQKFGRDWLVQIEAQLRALFG
ncbi:transcription-repair coupling factor [Candidatus Wirthbacteria bacterium CG2_30_54_11]|uniref:Transcription-repair-coupling factor n=1 Tax=Candidatus Wirthbacteria bacterium CG2_30_54_11 TaxID=1817892 RepID=A0A1J5IKS2_9BACT|nr:MAG: transcription-repair coupling factor [Candidatus Wirthbacteria bacterium CG2_30_54_11]